MDTNETMTKLLNKEPVEGFYGDFGGAFVPKVLSRHVVELKKKWSLVQRSSSFHDDYETLLRKYVGRPTPLYYAERLSVHYKTNVFFKREDLCHMGAHNINNALGQILLAKHMGRRRIVAETGSGQHGVATAAVCAREGLESVVYMGAKDVERQVLNVQKMRMMGAKVVSVGHGAGTLKDAVEAAMQDWAQHSADTYYLMGSVAGPDPYPGLVAKLQSVIGEEIQRQLPQPPDHLLACIGGGSNAAGAFYPFIGHPEVNLVGVEAAGKSLDSPDTPATLSRGKIGTLHASKSYVLQDRQGQVAQTRSLSAGLDYPGVGPLHAYLRDKKAAHYLAVGDEEALTAARLASRLEGIIPALETAHALAAIEKLGAKEDDTLVVCFSGRGDKDMSIYQEQLPA